MGFFVSCRFGWFASFFSSSASANCFGGSNNMATPKSALKKKALFISFLIGSPIFNIPYLSNKTFYGLKSRCMIPFKCTIKKILL